MQRMTKILTRGLIKQFKAANRKILLKIVDEKFYNQNKVKKNLLME